MKVAENYHRHFVNLLIILNVAAYCSIITENICKWTDKYNQKYAVTGNTVVTLELLGQSAWVRGLPATATRPSSLAVWRQLTRYLQCNLVLGCHHHGGASLLLNGTPCWQYTPLATHLSFTSVFLLPFSCCIGADNPPGCCSSRCSLFMRKTWGEEEGPGWKSFGVGFAWAEAVRVRSSPSRVRVSVCGYSRRVGVRAAYTMVYPRS